MRADLAAIGVFGVLLVVPEPRFIDTALAQDGGCSMSQLRGAYAVYGQGSGILGNPPLRST
jgi:hypothetical protein